MAKVKTAVMKAAMSGLYHTRAHRLLAPYTQGVGLIFMLHQVRPEPEPHKAFAPNRILEVSPEFLDAVAGSQVPEEHRVAESVLLALDHVGAGDEEERLPLAHPHPSQLDHRRDPSRCSTAARMKPLNRGWGANGLLLNSGWN